MSDHDNDIPASRLDDDQRASLDDHVRIAIDRLAHLYVTAAVLDDAAIYDYLIRAREHIDAAISICDNSR